MRKLAALVVALAILAPALAAQTAKPAQTAPTAQTAASFTGKWDGTFKLQQPDGTEGPARPIAFNLTQKGKDLTGTAGPPDQQLPIEKGAVAAGKATFQVQQPNGPLFKFALTIVKGRLQGEMAGEQDGVVRRQAKVDAGKAAK